MGPDEKEAATRIEAAFKGRRARQDLHDKIMQNGTEEQKAALSELEERRRRRENARLKKERKRAKRAKKKKKGERRSRSHEKKSSGKKSKILKKIFQKYYVCIASVAVVSLNVMMYCQNL